MALFSLAGFSAGPVAMVMDTAGRDQLEFGGTAVTVTVMCLNTGKSSQTLSTCAIATVERAAGHARLHEL